MLKGLALSLGFHEWMLKEGESAGAPGECLIVGDWLVTAPTLSAYKRRIAELLAQRSNVLLLAFDDVPLDVRAPETYFESIGVSVREGGRVAIPVGHLVGRTVFLIPAPPGVNRRDVSYGTLSAAWAASRRPDLLAESIVVSRAFLGFFPDHVPRCVEYPWVLDKIESAASTKVLEILEVGSGLSCVPFMLAKRGHEVTTVDPHERMATLETRETWTEWGFIDYGTLDKRIRSLNTRFEDFDSLRKFDVAISVSVVEHVPADLRRSWLNRIADLLVVDGTLLLTVDLIPFTDRLWPFSEGRMVDISGGHGTVRQLREELEAAGFDILNQEIYPGLPYTRVSLCMIEARLVRGD